MNPITTMKTNPIPMLAAVLLAAGCDRADDPTAACDGADGSGHLLSTVLPPEGLVGTPAPVHLPGAPSGQVPPSSSPGPGTEGVIYRFQPAAPATHPE